jgi:ABC-type transporter Mla subunit MlaD
VGLRRRVLGLTVTGTLLAVLSAGCGGGDALSKKQYVSQLNAMCQDFSAREKKIGEPQTVRDLAENGPRVLDAFEQAIADKVRNLKAPDEIADQADRLVELADAQRDVLADLVDAAQAKDVAKVNELVSKNEALNEEANSLTRKLGAKACAEK